jgi:hypothetical protein
VIDPAQLWRKAGESGARLLAVQSALIALIFALVFLGRSILLPPLAVMALAAVVVAATFGYILWRPLAMRPDGVSTGGALIAGAVSPLLGMICLDALGVILLAPAGSGGGLSSSVLLAFWPVGVVGVAAGLAAGLATASMVRRRFDHLNVSGMRSD